MCASEVFHISVFNELMREMEEQFKLMLPYNVIFPIGSFVITVRTLYALKISWMSLKSRETYQRKVGINSWLEL